MSPGTRRLLAAAAVTVIAITGTMVFITIPANAAQANRIASCQNFANGADPASWMNLMINSGKTGFVQAGTHLCAW